VGPGPEDMVLDTVTGRPRLLISCTGRREEYKPYGEIEAFDLTSEKRTVLSRTGEPDALVFRPHGIYLDGNTLYVISHEHEPDDHPILIYTVLPDRLEFRGMAMGAHQHSPNALVTGPGGEIYFVNDSGKRGSIGEKIFRLRRASVVRLSPTGSGEWKSEVVAGRLGYPAGINRIGDTLYVGDAILHRIHVFAITTGGLVETGSIRGLRGNDNIRISDGKLLVPGHVKPFRFIRHARDRSKISPVVVFLADPANDSVTSLFSNDGSLISAGSTAILFQGSLYISQVFDPYLLRVTL